MPEPAPFAGILACLPPSELLAPKPRPKTNASVAKRLLGHALGLPGLRDKGAEADLALQRRAAKEARQEKEAAREAAWE